VCEFVWPGRCCFQCQWVEWFVSGQSFDSSHRSTVIWFGLSVCFLFIPLTPQLTHFPHNGESCLSLARGHLNIENKFHLHLFFANFREHWVNYILNGFHGFHFKASCRTICHSNKPMAKVRQRFTRSLMSSSAMTTWHGSINNISFYDSRQKMRIGRNINYIEQTYLFLKLFQNLQIIII